MSVPDPRSRLERATGEGHFEVGEVLIRSGATDMRVIVVSVVETPHAPDRKHLYFVKGTHARAEAFWSRGSRLRRTP